MYTNDAYMRSMREHTITSTSHRVHAKSERTSGGWAGAADAQADARESGGYDVHNVCESCWTTKFANGSCYCD